MNIMLTLVIPCAMAVNLQSAAHRIGLWLNATSACDQHGCKWPMNSTDAAPLNHPFLADSLYYGPLGVAIYLQQLGSTQPGWRGLAMSALEAGREYATSGAAVQDFGSNAGFYYGLLGIAYGLRGASDGMPNASRFQDAAAGLETHVLSTVAPFSSNTSATLWNNTDIAHGAAGTGLYLLWLSKRASLPPKARQAALEAAIRAGHWLLSRAEPIGSDGGLRWARGPDTDGVHAHSYYPTFCCGGAGVAYMLSELSQAPGVVGTADAEGQRRAHRLLEQLHALEPDRRRRRARRVALRLCKVGGNADYRTIRALARLRLGSVEESAEDFCARLFW